MNGLKRTLAAAWAPVLVYAVLALGIFLGDHVLDAPKYDQDLYHHVAVVTFAEQWPAFDITDYESATSPLYHLVMASAAKVLGSDLDTLRVVSSLFGLALVVAVAGWAATFVSTRAAAFLSMPLAASVYVIGSGVHVHTDNMGWLLVILALGPVVFLAPRTDRWCLSGLLVLLAVSVRQVMIWAIGPLVLAGLLASPLRRFVPRGFDSDGETPGARSWSPLITSLLVAIPSLVVLFIFIGLWGGLVPPRFQELHASAYSFCAPAYGLADLAVYAPFFLVMVPRPLELLGRHRTVLLLFALLGVLLALAFPSSYSIDDGRYGGPVWLLVSKAPVVAERSLLLALMAGAGAVFLVFLVLAAMRNRRGVPALVLACSWCATHSTQLVNAQTFQRYFDTPTLVILAWFGALILTGRPDDERRSALGPSLLTIALALMLVADVLAG